MCYQSTLLKCRILLHGGIRGIEKLTMGLDSHKGPSVLGVDSTELKEGGS